MAVPMTGRLTDKQHKGWKYEVYPDERSPTGYVRKIWDPRDGSAGGRPQEFFENYDLEADQEADSAATATQQAAARQQAARAASDRADQEAFRASDTAYRQSVSDESRRRFDVGTDATERARQDTVQKVKDALKEQKREYDLSQGESKRQFDLSYGLKQQDAARGDAQLGADILKTGAGLRGADDLVQGWGYAQGVANAGLSPYVNAIRTGTATPYGGGTAVAGNPTPLTVGSLATAMGAGGGAPQTGTDAFGRPVLPADKQAFVSSVDQNLQKGIANNPLGFLENMTPDQKKGYFSAASWLGRDANAEKAYYDRSRPSQGSYL